MNSEKSGATPPLKGVEHAGVIDLMTFDPKEGVLTMLMVESRPWDGSELQMFQLQEKLNAYLSFLLDGELEDTYPDVAGKGLRIQLDCVSPPLPEVLHFLKTVREQVGFQGIDFQVRVKGPSCGEGCGCH